MSEHVDVSRHGAVVQLALNRPEKKNALTGAMYERMIEAIRAADADEATAAIVFSGCPGTFTAGNDIGDFLQAAGGIERSPAFRFIKAIASCATPLVAAVDGLAIGIGTTMLLHCDLAYATPASVFRMPFVELALVPEAASSLLLPRRIGTVKAAEMLLLGEGIDAAEAHRLGLLNGVLPASELLAQALARAQNFAAMPRAALAAARRLLRGDVAEVLARIDLEGSAFAAQIASAEARGMFMKFMAKSKG